MLRHVLIAGLAMGSLYALIGLTYNFMYSTSRVISLTSGQLGMFGAVLGAHFLGVRGWPTILSLLAVLAIGALVGVVTELIAVRPVLAAIDQKLYVLTTLALGLMIQHGTALWWGTEPRPFPRLTEVQIGGVAPRFWLPIVVCLIAVPGLALFYRRTMMGRAFMAISEDAYAAQALGLPERRLRVLSYAMAGMMGSGAGFAAGQLLFAYFAVGQTLMFNGFVAIALGGLGSSIGALLGGFTLGLVEESANFYFGGSYKNTAALLVLVVALVILPSGVFGKEEARRV